MRTVSRGHRGSLISNMSFDIYQLEVDRACMTLFEEKASPIHKVGLFSVVKVTLQLQMSVSLYVCWQNPFSSFFLFPSTINHHPSTFIFPPSFFTFKLFSLLEESFPFLFCYVKKKIVFDVLHLPYIHILSSIFYFPF